MLENEISGKINGGISVPKLGKNCVSTSTRISGYASILNRMLRAFSELILGEFLILRISEGISKRNLWGNPRTNF